MNIARYRERFADKGLYENTVYPGVEKLLASLKEAGISVALATSKPTVYALRILRRPHGGAHAHPGLVKDEGGRVAYLRRAGENARLRGGGRARREPFARGRRGGFLGAALQGLHDRQPVCGVSPLRPRRARGRAGGALRPPAAGDPAERHGESRGGRGVSERRGAEDRGVVVAGDRVAGLDLLAVSGAQDLDDELVGGGTIEGEGGLAAEFAGDRDVFHGVFP